VMLHAYLDDSLGPGEVKLRRAGILGNSSSFARHLPEEERARWLLSARPEFAAFSKFKRMRRCPLPTALAPPFCFYLLLVPFAGTIMVLNGRTFPGNSTFSSNFRPPQHTFVVSLPPR